MSTDSAIGEIGRWQQWSLWIGVCSLAVSADRRGRSLRRRSSAHIWRPISSILGIALGSMVLLMAYHLTGGSWGLLIRRILEAAMRTLPLLAVLFVPIAVGVGYIYVWAQPDAVAASPKLQYQQFYLRPSYFWIRAAVYFALWLAIGTAAESLVAPGRPNRRPAAGVEEPEAQRFRRGGLRHQHPFRGGRLGHVAAAGVPFVDLGADVRRGQTALGDGLRADRAGLPDRPAAAGRSGVAERCGTIWEACC